MVKYIQTQENRLSLKAVSHVKQCDFTVELYINAQSSYIAWQSLTTNS